MAAVRNAADSAACQGYMLAGPDAAAMGARCTTTIPAGFPDDWAVLVVYRRYPDGGINVDLGRFSKDAPGR